MKTENAVPQMTNVDWPNSLAQHDLQFNAMLDAYAKDVFFDRLFRDSRVSITARFSPYTLSKYENLMLRDELQPGQVISLVDDVAEKPKYTDSGSGAPSRKSSKKTERKEHLRMYLTHVVHTIDVNAGTATTTLAGSHARGPKGAVSQKTDKVIVETRKLAMYVEKE